MTHTLTTVVGDSNGDGKFDSADFVAVFIAGEYEDDISGNSSFEEGDWNGDGDFNSSDFVAAFEAGIYVAAVKPRNHQSLWAGAVDGLFNDRDEKEVSLAFVA